MPITTIRGGQVTDGTVQRVDLDVSTVGQAVVRKIVQGTGIALSSTGADSGSGDVTVTAAPVVSTDAGNIATIGTDNQILVPQSQIWSVRQRSFNAIGFGNASFEVDQINCGQASLAQGIRNIDRWSVAKSGATGNVQVQQMSGPVLVPGTNFAITSKFLRITLTATQASLAAGDRCDLTHVVEASVLRELISDVTSAQLLVRSSVANLNFGFVLNDAGNAYSLPKLCNIPTANAWILIPLANLPIWTASGSFPITPGTAGYTIHIGLAHGSTWLPGANNAWIAGNFLGALGETNFFNSLLNSTYDVAFLQHEPGAVCSGLMDLDFDTNLSRCQRYFQKSYVYGTKPQTASVGAGLRSAIVPVGVTSNPVGPLNFLRTMAKTPTINIYAYDGSANNVTLIGGGNLAISSVMQPSDSGFQGIALSAAATAGQAVQFHYTADTGW